MTDNEIFKALECCAIKHDCNECPYKVEKCKLLNSVLSDALDLINRQQAEIDRLQLEKEKLEIKLKCNIESSIKSTNSAMEVIKKQEAEIERLQKVNDSFTDIGKLYSEIKADAISLFAERLKEKAYLTDRKIYAVLQDDIDNLVKEMVGDTE